MKKRENIQKDIQETSKCTEEMSVYIKPNFKPLTQEQIDDIHSRGKITPEEKVKELVPENVYEYLIRFYDVMNRM